MWPLDAQVTTALANPLTCLPVCTSKICFSHAQSCSFPHFPNQTTSAQGSVAMVVSSSATSNLFTSIKVRAKPTLPFLLLVPFASSIQAFLWAGCQPLAPNRPQQFRHTSPHVIFLKDPIFPEKRESHITLLSSRLLSAASCSVFVLTSTPSVSTLVAKTTPSFGACLKPLLQISAGSDCFALSFWSSLRDRQLQALLLYFSLQLLQSRLCHLHQLLVPPIHNVNTTPQMTYFLGAKRVQNNYR